MRTLLLLAFAVLLWTPAPVQAEPTARAIETIHPHCRYDRPRCRIYRLERQVAQLDAQIAALTPPPAPEAPPAPPAPPAPAQMLVLTNAHCSAASCAAEAEAVCRARGFRSGEAAMRRSAPQRVLTQARCAR